MADVEHAMMRRLYLWLSAWWGDRPLPAEPSAEWPKARLRSAQTWSRYFLVGNIIRAGTLSPVMGHAISNLLFWPLLFLGYPMLVHGILVSIELYKQALIVKLLPDSPDDSWEPAPKYPDLPSINRSALRIFQFESPALYRAFGMEQVRLLVHWYVAQAMGKGRTVRFMDRSGRRAAIDFAMESCVAESIHARGAAINTFVLILILRNAPLWLNLWLGLWVFGEWCLVLLQRYMRVRVYVALSKRQGNLS